MNEPEPTPASVPSSPPAEVTAVEPKTASEASSRDRLLQTSFAMPVRRMQSAVKPPSTRVIATRETEPPMAKPAGAEYLSVKGALHERLLDELDRRNLMGGSEETLKEFVETFVAEAIRAGQLPLNDAEHRRLVEDLLEETLGVGPLAPLLADPAVSDILVNRPDQVYIERFGRLEKTDVRFRDADHLVRIIQRIAARIGRRIDEGSPMVDARLPDGSRVNATLIPATLDSPTLSIRRFGRHRLRRADLVQLGMFSPEMHALMEALVQGRKNLLISGGTGSGKSTLLGAVAEAIPDRERIITIEDAAELILDQVHLVRMETRPPNVEGRGLITARDLLSNALRMRPDRIIVGEVRGGEALDMLQAMNTGHDGSLTTVHANSPRDALSRLETMVLMAGLDLPSRAIREQIVAALHLIVHVRHFEDGVRRVESIAEIAGMENNTPQLQDIFRFERRGTSGRRITGEFVATGIVPRAMEELRQRGIDVPRSIFQKPASQAAAQRSMVETFILLIVMASGAAVAAYAWRNLQIRQRAQERVGVLEEGPGGIEPRTAAEVRPFLPRHRVLPWSVGAVAGLLVYFGLGWTSPFAVAIGVILGLLGGQIEGYWAARKTARIEAQLADAIDLLVGALGAGAGLLNSLEHVLSESKLPLRPQLEEMLGRIRFGDDPQAVFRGLVERVPLETFQLFASALAVHWETGGNLAPILSNVGRTIRDRIEISLRIQSNIAQSQVSTLAVLGLTYFLALIVWRTNPSQTELFLSNLLGQGLAAGTILLQAAGIAWMSAISRLRY